LKPRHKWHEWLSVWRNDQLLVFATQGQWLEQNWFYLRVRFSTHLGRKHAMIVGLSEGDIVSIWSWDFSVFNISLSLCACIKYVVHHYWRWTSTTHRKKNRHLLSMITAMNDTVESCPGNATAVTLISYYLWLQLWMVPLSPVPLMLQQLR
jgi:hypothetical protein